MLTLPYHKVETDTTVKQPKFDFISIPTSLSGGEYSNFSGATKDTDHMKIQFSPPLRGPKVIILDPELAIHTPMSFWLASGFRAIDHCTETLCSLKSKPEADEAAIKGLQCLVPGLLHTKANEKDVQARLETQFGVNYAMTPIHVAVYPGASHGIGHNLGPFGVGHGETSCILLPAVCKYNAAQGANNDRQDKVREVLWNIPEAKELFQSKGLTQKESDLGDLIDAIIRALGLPRNLSQFGIGEDKFESIAENSIPDFCTICNPAPLKTKEPIIEILKMCA
jgi:alcohol dehydrogenase class IV